MTREVGKEGNKIKKQNVKLRKNALFGNSVENPINKVVVKLVTTRKQYLKRPFRPTLKREKQFRNGIVAIEKEKCRIYLNEPIYFGTSILNLNKVLMQDIHYNYMKNKYGGKAEMLLTDTDNLLCI